MVKKRINLGRIIAVGAALLLFLSACSKSAWLVDSEFEQALSGVLANPDTAEREHPFLIELYTGTIPKNRYGFIITTKKPEAGENGGLIAYTGLLEKDYADHSFALALDPWLIFREWTDSPLTRSRAENGGAGNLIAPGSVQEAARAWTAQLGQREPGVFSEYAEEDGAERSLSQPLAQSLFAGNRFQRGALTYNWANAWELFLTSKPAWIYAPYSAVRALRSFQTAGLEADRFPIPNEWNSYGVQAAILWAIPFGDTRYTKKLEKTKEWLQNPATQFAIAEKIHFLPADPEARSYNALARSAQRIILRAAFFWTF